MGLQNFNQWKLKAVLAKSEEIKIMGHLTEQQTQQRGNGNVLQFCLKND